MPANTIAQPKAPEAPKEKETKAAPPAQVPPLSNRPSANEEIEAAFSGKDPVGNPDIIEAKSGKQSKAAPQKAPAEPKQQKAAEEKPEVEAKTEPQPDPNDEFLVDSIKADAAEEKPAEEKKPEPEPMPVKAPELRAAYAKVKARAAELQKELDSLKAKPVEDTERKTLTEEITGLKKKLEEATAQIKFAAYEQSDEYKQKYETPFVDAWNDGVDQISSLTVTTPAGETRKGNADDFAMVMRESSNESAAIIAKELFGDNAFYVLSARRELQRLNSARTKALNEYRATMQDRIKAETETTVKAKEEAEKARLQRVMMFKKFNEEAAQKYPDLFAPLEGDEEGNKILEKGFKSADLAFEGGNGLTPEQVIRLHSAIRNRSAGFGRLVHRLKQKDAQIAELEKTLEELRGSTPGPGQVAKSESGPKELTLEEELEAAANRRR